MSTVIFCDSRGRFLENEIRKIDNDVSVCYYPGCTTAGMHRKIRCYTRSHYVTRAYIMVGINDITQRNPYTRNCIPTHRHPNALRNHIMELYINLKRYCLTECGIDEVIFCSMVGIGLTTYNKAPSSARDQWVINQGVRLLNGDIITYNSAWGHHTPTIHQSIHVTMYHPYRHRDFYNRLWDGLHPSTITTRRWARSIVAAERLNRDN